MVIRVKTKNEHESDSLLGCNENIYGGKEEGRVGILFLFAVAKKRSAFLVSSYFFLIFA